MCAPIESPHLCSLVYITQVDEANTDDTLLLLRFVELLKSLEIQHSHTPAKSPLHAFVHRFNRRTRAPMCGNLHRTQVEEANADDTLLRHAFAELLMSHASTPNHLQVALYHAFYPFFY